TPKLLHSLCGRPMIEWPVAAASDAGAETIVVVDSPARPLAPVVDGRVVIAVQERALGTADAVRAASAHISPESTVIVINGDVPLITAETIRGLAAAHAHSGAAGTIATAVLADPEGYGRIVRAPDGTVERVVETKAPGDATEGELHIREINTGIFAFDGGLLLEALAQVRNDNAQGEFYLPDVLPILRESGRTVDAYEVADENVTLGVNDRVGLAEVRAIAQRRINEGHMLAGVTIVDPVSTIVDAGVDIGEDTVIAPFTSLLGETAIGARCVVGPASTVIDSRLADEATVVHSYLTGADVGERASVGPFAYLRPGAVLHAGAKAGTFVEIKNSDIGAGTKVPHLSYIGDTDIGERSNIGAGTITANYDGYRKNRTTIGSGVRVSVDTTLVAPVTVGDDAFTAAGSVITEDVPPGALGVARQRQSNLEGYAQRRAERAGAEKAAAEKAPANPAPAENPAATNPAATNPAATKPTADAPTADPAAADQAGQG
ncbi:MAG: bifunctional UDP-N-acetylglucosamine diphosphorylase/glucosamine-1-phosphate N-acetyltransferase GlmU, partial [Actinomycetota bacterium]|nr:bifunctional UDP-N-acetylglucosamine diphosphorylase/glucosamine-1-phosphate N-acetyltransferase GlmU [Actinomycetota bacterium]